MSFENAPSKAATLPILYSFSSTDALANGLGEFVIQAQEEALKKNSTFKIAISGGSLPKTLGEGLLSRTDVKWDKWEVFFADERVVPLDHEDSNYNAVHQHLFSKVPISKENIHTIDTTLLNDPEACADEYEKQLVAAFVGKDSVAFPRFDLCLLGIGPDGHTCSLFPNHELLHEEDGWVGFLTDSPKPPSTRITLTFPVLNHSHRVAFVASGKSKIEILESVLDNPERGLPCSRVRVKNPGRVYWFADEAATERVKYPKTLFNLNKL